LLSFYWQFQKYTVSGVTFSFKACKSSYSPEGIGEIVSDESVVYNVFHHCKQSAAVDTQLL